MDNLEGMDEFLEKYNILKLDQEKIENMDRKIINIEIETMIKSLPTNKIPGPDSFTSGFHQMFREELTLILLKGFQKIGEEGKSPNSFYEATITLIQNKQQQQQPGRDNTQKRKLQANITHENRGKYPQQNSSEQNSTIL